MAYLAVFPASIRMGDPVILSAPAEQRKPTSSDICIKKNSYIFLYLLNKM
jgi:hypothetical protein